MKDILNNISKSLAGKPQSVKGVMPWVNINFGDAKEVATTIENNEAVKWCTNNIYDFAGNVDEWTQEKH